MNAPMQDTQAMLADSVDRFLAQDYGFARRRERLAAGAADRSDWRRFAGFGWLGLPFPEDAGGFGGSLLDVALLMQRFGRALVLEPYLPSVVLAGGLIDRLGSAAQKARYLTPLIDGDLQLTVASSERHARHDVADCQTVAEVHRTGIVLNGRKHMVWGGASADVFIVPARDAAGGLSLYLVERSDAGVTVTGFPTVDGHHAAELVLVDVTLTPDRRLGPAGEALPELHRTLDTGAAMCAAEGVGVMQVLFDDTLAYLKERRQFGKALASHQALQHRLVDMHTLLREADVMARMAVQALDDADASRRARAVSTAKVHVSQALRQLGQEAVQLHGAIGTTDEYHISHYFKRATALSMMSGDADHHRTRLATLLRAAGASPATNLIHTPADLRFAEEIRTFIAQHLPLEIARRVGQEQYVPKEDVLTWQRALAGRGWLAHTWPAEDGGPGWTPRQQFIFEAVSMEMDCPGLSPFGLRMLGRVLQRFGTPPQKARFLPPILASTEWWCQGYSEPNAGSDLASLQTRADRHGDHYVVNGSKIWTSYAHWADWMFCLVRTDRQSKAQQGISFLLIDMKSPGIEVRAIPQMDGIHSFNQVFFTDVVVPVENLVGDEHQGWTCAKYLLTHERLETVSLAPCQRTMRRLKAVAHAPVEGGAAPADDPLFMARLVDAEVRLSALELRVLDFLEHQEQGAGLGPEVSELKIRGTELYQALLELLMLASRDDALAYHREFVFGEAGIPPVGPAHAATAATRYFNRRSMSILGGSNEIQHNVVAKAVLGIVG